MESTIITKLDTLNDKLKRLEESLHAEVHKVVDGQRKLEFTVGASRLLSLPAGSKKGGLQKAVSHEIFLAGATNGSKLFLSGGSGSRIDENFPTGSLKGESHQTDEVAPSSGRSKASGERRREYMKDWAKKSGGTVNDLSAMEGWNLRCEVGHDAKTSPTTRLEGHIAEEEEKEGAVSQQEVGGPIFFLSGCDEKFDYFFGLLIVANSAVLGAQVQIMAVHEMEDPPPTIDALQTAFTYIFLFELIIRLVGLKREFFTIDLAWNIFDVVIVSVSVIEVLFQLFVSDGESDGTQGFSALRILRILRIVRVVRVIRIFRFFSELRLMVYAILASGGPLFWAMMLLSIILYIVAVFFTQAVTDYRAENDDRLSIRLEQYYASLFETMYFLFQGMCGGVAWGDITAPLIELHWAYAALMVLFTCFTLLALLNIITGVFVESAFAKAQSDREAVVQAELKEETQKMQQLDEVFNEIDKNNTGYLTIHEFEAVVADPRVVAYFRSMGVHISTAYHLFRLLDLDNSNTVSSSEFVLGCLRLQGAAKNVDVATLMYENKRMMLKWVSFMDFVEEKFQEVFEAIRQVSPLATVPVVEKLPDNNVSDPMPAFSTNSMASYDDGLVTARRRSWREKTLGQHSSLNIYDTMDPANRQ
eukprot:CAMPEP_0169200838 /NCGR_PEP_ID=MMETSP1016-20121227/10086_1 /TAXON_ID=342587 /ORGANISM="Karlodinium micrum, Strain CCMP2283" /LENGTH=644 /DNA_ID=CAMNT_0009277721 /DNA_START=145 /DNA_END=2078 /DNA_ORIENTATION=+